MPEYRPISLSNVVSRMVSKVLANKVKGILPNIISNAQSAFVPDKLITDNTAVAYEMLHRLRNKRQWKVGHMAIKLDISKAYDRVEWEFLQNIMFLSQVGRPSYARHVVIKLFGADQWRTLGLYLPVSRY